MPPVPPPEGGEIIQSRGGKLRVPDRPVIPFVEGDGIGADITPPMRRVVDAAVRRAYGDRRRIMWTEIFAGEKAAARFGENQFLPAETLDAMRQYAVSIKGPLSTPTGGGIRSLNVAVRKSLDLYACVRPVRYFDGVNSPLKNPQNTRMTVFRENTEDIYAGIEWPSESPEARRVLDFLQNEMGATVRFPDTSAVGVKPVSSEGSRRLARRALQYAMDARAESVTLVHKGNIMKYTEGAFMRWGYELAEKEFGARPLDGGAWRVFHNPKSGGDIVVKDFIADNFLQQILIKPADFDVVATLNLNGDYISDALAAQVGGIGIAPGANMSDDIAVFEATHGTAPKHAGFNRANPGSLILSAEMMLRHIGWDEAAENIIAGMSRAIASGKVTYDLARGRKDAAVLSSSDFGEAVVAAMDPDSAD